MNCQEGDIAIFIAGPNRDRMCRVVSPYDPMPLVRFIAGVEGPCWTIVMLQSGVRGVDGMPISAGTEGWTQDKDLRPIRDPGDDAVDEMVLLKGKPGSTDEDVLQEQHRELEEAL